MFSGLISVLAASITAIVFVLMAAAICAAILKMIRHSLRAGLGEQIESEEYPSEDESRVCPNRTCGHANRPVARFCSQCGQRLR